MSAAEIPGGMAVDLEAEREASMERQTEAIAPALLTMRAEQIMRAVAPALTRDVLGTAADRLYSQLDEAARVEIVGRALELIAAGVRHRPGDPLRADTPKPRLRPRRPRNAQPAEPAHQTTEAGTRRYVSKHPARDEIRKVIQPLLEAEPATTAGEARDAVEAAGVELPPKGAINWIWLELLQDLGLHTEELKAARALRTHALLAERRRAAKANAPMAPQPNSPLKPPKQQPQKQKPAAAAAPQPPVARVSNGCRPAILPAPAPVLSPGISLVPGLDGTCRLRVDVTVPSDGAYLMAAVVAQAIDVAMGEEVEG